jgi:hypothetical protein
MLLAMLVVAILGGLAAGIVVARGGSSRVQGRPGVIAQGKFRSVSWTTSGTAAIVRDASGHLKLRLSKAFGTRRAPDLWVYLARFKGGYLHGRRVEWKDVGELRQPWGPLEFDLPADAAKEVGASVVIFCGECGKINGLARLAPASRS